MGNKIGSDKLAEEDKLRKAKGQTEKNENETGNLDKIVMLGAGECGKSTLFRQMGVLYGKGFSDAYRTTYRASIHEMCIEGAQQIIRALQSEFADDPEMKIESQEILNTIEDVQKFSKINPFNQQIAESLLKFWSDGTIKRALWKSTNPLLSSKESLAFFFENVNRISDRDYQPTDQDLLLMRVRTTGLPKEQHQIDELKFMFHDTGGQRNERRKWINLFENVTTVVYVASLSEYDEVLFEDEKANRVRENLECFEQCMARESLVGVPVILVFTTTDIFEQKFTKSPISCYFPEFEGTTTSDAQEFFKKLYLQQIKSRTDQEPRQVFVHYVNATDPESCKQLFKSIKEDIAKIKSKILCDQ
jgi:guanine nucleotide-binding protein G(i) subunit alpha